MNGAELSAAVEGDRQGRQGAWGRRCGRELPRRLSGDGESSCRRLNGACIDGHVVGLAVGEGLVLQIDHRRITIDVNGPQQHELRAANGVGDGRGGHVNGGDGGA